MIPENLSLISYDRNRIQIHIRIPSVNICVKAEVYLNTPVTLQHYIGCCERTVSEHTQHSDSNGEIYLTFQNVMLFIAIKTRKIPRLTFKLVLQLDRNCRYMDSKFISYSPTMYRYSATRINFPLTETLYTSKLQYLGSLIARTPHGRRQFRAYLSNRSVFIIHITAINSAYLYRTH
jgi:hypothetical protein